MIKKLARIVFSALLCVLLLAQPTWAIDVSPGDRIELQGTSSLGVPLHETSSSSFVGRTPSGTIATVVGTTNNQRWIQIKLASGAQNWIVERYIARIISPPDDTEDPLSPTPEPISSSETIFPDLSGEALRSRLAREYRVKSSLGYDKARDFMYSELDNDNGVVSGIYSGFTVEVNPNSSTPRSDAYQNGQGINAEHTWPQGRGATGVAKSDIHHLFPSKVRVNSLRGSFPLAEIDDSRTKR